VPKVEESLRSTELYNWQHALPLAHF